MADKHSQQPKAGARQMVQATSPGPSRELSRWVRGACMCGHSYRAGGEACGGPGHHAEAGPLRNSPI